jgi:hypothetical protein
MRTALAILVLFFAGNSWAQDTEKPNSINRLGPYLGVQPGAQDQAPGKAQVRSRGAVRLVTWVGFQMSGQGGRVFIQSTEPATYDIVPGNPDEVIIELSDTKLHSTNDGRLLDTAWFPTAVLSVKAVQKKKAMTRVTIKLREVVGYDLRQEGNYIFLDFRPPQGNLATPKIKTPTPQAQ